MKYSITILTTHGWSRMSYLLCAFLFVCSCNQSNSSNTIVIKVAHNAGEGHAYQDGYLAFGEELEKAGKVDFQIFPSSQIAEEAIEMVKLGVIASSTANVGALGSFVPEADLFNFPFLFRDLDHFYNVVDGPVGEHIAGKIEDRLDCKVLGWWYSGVRNVWNSDHPIYKPEDLNGLKIRVIGSPVVLQSFDAFGAQATSMSFGALYSAVQQRVLDGAECDNTDIQDMKFYEVTKYVSSTEHLFSAVALLYSNKQYNKLPPKLQQAVLVAGRHSVKVQRQAMEEKTQEALIFLKEKGIIFNEVDKKPFQEIAQEIYKKNADKVGGTKLIDQVINQ